MNSREHDTLLPQDARVPPLQERFLCTIHDPGHLRMRRLGDARQDPLRRGVVDIDVRLDARSGGPLASDEVRRVACATVSG